MDLDRALRGVLDAAEGASPVQAVEAVTRELGVALGATSVAFLIADLSGRALVRLTHAPLVDGAHTARDDEGAPGDRLQDEESATVLTFDGGPAERALRTQEVQVLEPGEPYAGGRAMGEWLVLAPVTERGEAIGLLELSLPVAPTACVQEEIARTALVLAYVVIASRRHTDLFEWGQRSIPFTLSAEIQRRLLPSAFTCEAAAFTLSAWLEPAASIGGDTFDYILARDLLHLSVTDAMGHGVASALTATLCMSALRNSRRLGASLVDQAVAANAALVEHQTSAADEGFATGVLGRLDLRTGVLSLLNAGHAPPYLARGASVELLQLPAGLPLGMFPDVGHAVTAVTLRPGDRIVFVTDGMLERNAADVDLAAQISRTRGLHPREATRALADLVIAASGASLADDATLLVLDWHGDHGQGRQTSSGADAGRAGGAS
jgi:serine phosphatase RsbU (regulator of sigma subunit)